MRHLWLLAAAALPAALHAADVTHPKEKETQEPKSESRFRTYLGRLVTPGAIVFESGTAALRRAESEEALAHVVAYLGERKDITLFRIEARSDEPGEESRDRMSAQSLAVAKELVGRGIRCERLIPVAIVPETPPETKKGERIEFRPALIDHAPIFDLPVDGGGWVAGDPCE